MLQQIHSQVMAWVMGVTLFVQRMLSYIPSMIYDTLISDTITNYSYERLVTLIKKHPLPKERPLRMLDIGVGTAVPLFNIWNSLPKNIEVVGVDIDHSYILKAQRQFKEIIKSQGSRQIKLQEINFYEMQTTEKFDLIVFSSSFMLMPFRERALELAKSMLCDDGKILFILPLEPSQAKKSYLTQVIEYWKPKLKYLITIDFGSITYEDDFQKLLDDANLKTTYKERLQQQYDLPTMVFRYFLLETRIQKTH